MDVDRYWRCYAAEIEEGLIDESGKLLPHDLERSLEAYRDWCRRHALCWFLICSILSVELFQGARNVRAGLVSISLNHGKCFVPADPFDCR